MNEILRRYTWQFDRPSPALRDKADDNVAQCTLSANISESEREYLIKAELPDVDRDDIYVSIKHGALTIAGERKTGERKQYIEEDETCQRVENLYGKLSRTFALPANIDESKIVVGYKMGVLHIQIPKSEESD